MQYLLDLTPLEAERLADTLADTSSGFHPSGSIIYLDEEQYPLLRGESIERLVSAANDHARNKGLTPLLPTPGDMDLRANSEMLELLAQNFAWDGERVTGGPAGQNRWNQMMEDYPRAISQKATEPDESGMLELPPRPTGERIIAAAAAALLEKEKGEKVDPVAFAGPEAAQTARMPSIARRLRECHQLYNPSHVIDAMLWSEAEHMASELLQTLSPDDTAAVRRLQDSSTDQ